MSGEHNLKTLLQTMNPQVHGDVFVFCSLPRGKDIPAGLKPLMTFSETEGVTLIIRKDDAEAANLSYQFPSRLITLAVHSALDAVGFIAAIATCLAKAGISVNPVSAFYHDHIFVPVQRADEAMSILANLQLARS
ncbi:MAG: ACT domain-containing protein [Alphaproteobacteria bacterium]|nr:ACT domain-containing protein [Alphaproteobacteria bacterium]